MKANIFYLILIFSLFQNIKSASNKIGNPINLNVTTGQVNLFTFTLPLNITTTYVITFPTTMVTNILQAGVAIIGTNYIIERQHGLSLFVNQIDQSQLTIQAQSKYNLNSRSSMISYLGIRYIVSCHPYLDITFIQYTFLSSQNVNNIYNIDTSCNYIRCRKTNIPVIFSAAKASALSITGVPFISGFATKNLIQDSQVNLAIFSNFGNYTLQNYYGISLQLSSFTTTGCTLSITVYGFVELSQISSYFITYQSSLTNTYKTRVVSGTSSVGCFYDGGGCTVPLYIKVNSNATFKTDDTFLTNYFDNMYFFGLNHFIVYEEYSDTIYNASPYVQPTIKMSFNSSSTTVLNTAYKTSISFSGNPFQLFSFKFGFVIDLNFDCTSSVDIYHISSTQCDAACANNFYPDANNYCWRCSSQCRLCNGPTNNDCTSCYTTNQFRVLNGSSCVCQQLYYYDNNVTDVCTNCSYTCLTCFFSSNSSCLSCNTTDFRYYDGNNSCPCNSSYYDNGGRTCVRCDITCQTCSDGNANSCITCPSLATSFRNISGTQCPCIAGYINTGAVICSKCLYSCKTCTSNTTNCDTCETNYNRTLVNGTCICTNGFYDDGISPICKTCFSTCKWCNGGTFSDCVACYGSDNRAINIPTGQCLCITGFYQFSNICYACHYTCLNCTSNTLASCQSCDATQFRTFNANTSTCPCNNGFFDPFTTPTPTPICQSCNPTCVTCQFNATYCLTCSAAAKRQLISNSCPCIAGYTDVSGTCLTCHYSCITCSGVLATNCLTCNMTDRYQSNTSCLCRPGTYDNGMQYSCLPCHVQCVTCDGGTNSSCLGCDASMKRVIASATTPNFCNCMTHYYDEGPAACSTCFSQCQSCMYNSTYCLTCYVSQFRTINASHVCSCLTNYYDTGADVCLTCANPCYECSIISTNCTSCPVLRTLVNNTCVCINNYYEDLTNGSCIQCGILCQLCTGSTTQCTLCYTNMYRYLSSLQCICSYGYYDNGINPICQTCPYYCQNCSGLTSCNSCDATAHRYMNSTICSCMPGYYDNGVSLTCLNCSQVCQQCSDFAVCTDCDGSLQRQLILNNCVCVGSFYDSYSLANPVAMCQPCHYSCATCYGGLDTNCLTCQTLRNFTNYSCPCSDGYYDSMQVCNLCDSLCRTCFGIHTNCTSCYSGLPFANNTCLCYSGQYLSGNVCYACDPKCKQCFGVSSFCTDCYTSQFTNLVGNDCVCNSSSYRDTVTLICTICHTTCMECVGPTSNNCTACDSNDPVNRVPLGSECICQANHFLNIANDLCVQCHPSCITCIGASNYNCSACQPNYTLIGSYCSFNTICANYLYDGQCVNVCPKNSYPTPSHTCQKCINGCLYCLSETICLECLPGYFYNSTTRVCIAICQIGMYVDASGNCLLCQSNCLECQWNAAKNQVTCLRCASLYYLKDSQCTQNCPIPYYFPIGSQCLKCVGNCLTCNSLSAADCVLCKTGMSYLASQCFQICPLGYYSIQLSGSVQPTCQLCQLYCASCRNGQCISCKSNYYLSNGKCVQNGFFFDNTSNQTKQCHPNCISCTNTSFSSCVICRPHRGDSTQMAISGYCECEQTSIDMGNGVCDFEKYTELLQITQTLVSYSSATVYLTTLTSIVSTNFIGLIGIMSYLQAYSTLYYLNSSMVMNIDYVLEEYRMANINSYFRLQSASLNSQPSNRLLVQLQNDKSLFLRNQPYLYLIQWSIIPTILIVIVWTISITTICIIRFRIKVNKTKSQFKKYSEYQLSYKNILNGQNYISPKQNPRSNKTNGYIFQDQEQQNSAVSKYIIRFHRIFHQSASIIIQLIFSSQIVWYGVVSFKIIQNEHIQIGKFIFSILLFSYIVIYTFRLFLGVFKYIRKKNQHQALSPKNSLKLLFNMHEIDKCKLLNAIFLPALLLRNQLINVIVVSLSYNPNYQILGFISVILIFAVYSVLFCPYRTIFRFFLHLSDLAFISQTIVLFFVSQGQYGYIYSLDILSNQSTNNLYICAWTLLVLNFLQITIYGLLGLFIVYNIGKDKLCKNKGDFGKQNNQKQFLNQKCQKFKSFKNKLKSNNESMQTLEVQYFEQMVLNMQNPGVDHKIGGEISIPILQLFTQSTQNQNDLQENNAQIKKQTQIIIKKYRVKKNKKNGNSKKDTSQLKQEYTKYNQFKTQKYQKSATIQYY